MTNKLSTFVITGGAALAIFAGDASGQILKAEVFDGNNAGPYRKNGGDQYGAGAEQFDIATGPDGSWRACGISSKDDRDEQFSNQEIVQYDVNQNNRNNRGQHQMLCVNGWIVQLADGSSQVIAPPMYGSHQVTDSDGNLHATSMIYVTDNDGDRYRNAMHPGTTRLGNYTVDCHNYAKKKANGGKNRAERYCAVFNADGENINAAAEEAPFGTDDSNFWYVFGNEQVNPDSNRWDDFCEMNQNEEQTHSLDVGDDGTMTAIVGTSCGGNGSGRDDSHYFTMKVTVDAAGEGRVEYVDYAVTEKEEQRTRPNVECEDGLITGLVDMDSEEPIDGPVQLCNVVTSAGNNQPPKKGITMRVIGVEQATGEIHRVAYHKIDDIGQEIREQNREGRNNNKKIWSVMPELIRLEGADGSARYRVEFYHVEENDGRGGNNRRKGTPVPYYREFSQDLSTGDIILAERQSDVIHDNTHAAIMPLGKNGRVKLRGSFQGSANATLEGALWEGGQWKVCNELQLPTTEDLGWTSKLFGNNPVNQGRDFASMEKGVDTGGNPWLIYPATPRRLDPATLLLDEKQGLDLVAVSMSELCGGVDANGDPIALDIDGEETRGKSGSLIGCSSAGTAGLSSVLLIGLALLALRRRRVFA